MQHGKGISNHTRTHTHTHTHTHGYYIQESWIQYGNKRVQQERLTDRVYIQIYIYIYIYIRYCHAWLQRLKVSPTMSTQHTLGLTACVYTDMDGTGVALSGTGRKDTHLTVYMSSTTIAIASGVV